MLLGMLAAALLLAVLVFFAVGPDRFWRLARPPDLGPVAFETLERRATPNDALACPPGFCRAAGDHAPPVFAISAADLRRAFAAMVAGEPRVKRVAIDDAAMTERWIQRSRIMKFPDTIDVRFLDLPGGRSTLALYSRSQLGSGDMGVNRARIERWLGRLEAAVTAPPAASARPSATPPAAARGSR